MLELVTTLRIFISCVEKYPHDMVAGAVASRALTPLAQATELCVRGVLEEYQNAAAHGNLVALLSAIWFIREFCEASLSARVLVRQHGGPKLLGPALLNPQADDHLLRESVHLLHCLQGPTGLLQTIPEVLQGGPRVLTALLWRLRECNREASEEFAGLPPKVLLQAAMSSIEAHPDNNCVHDAALALLADLLGSVEYRTSFAEVGGWPYLLIMLEARRADIDVQRRGLQILCELQRGGAWGGEYMPRVGQVVMSALESFYEDKSILEWGIWLLLELGGLPEVLKMLETAGETSTVGLGALRSLRQVHWGQTERADMSIVPEFVRVVGATAMRALQNSLSEALEVAVKVLLDAAHAAAGGADEQLPASVLQARADAVKLVFEVLQRRMLDVQTVERCLQVVRICQVAPEGASVQKQIRESLLSSGLLQRLADAHPSQDAVQKRVLWAQGVLVGPGAVVRLMERLDGSLPCWLAGVKTLGHLYHDLEELDTETRGTREVAMRSVILAMQTWPAEVHLLTHSCFALSAFAAHGVDNMDGGVYTAQHLQHGLQAAWQLAVAPAEELDQQGSAGCRSQAHYMRHEILRVEIESLESATEPLRQQFRAEALRLGVAAAQCKALMRDSRANEVEPKCMTDHLRQALVALGLCGQAEHTVELLRQGGSCWQPVVTAAAEAAVQLSRMGIQAELQRAGLGEAARSVREEWQQSGRRMDVATVQALEALQFAEGWAMTAAP